MLLANTVAILATEMLEAGGPNIGAVGAWGGLVAYSFQIFFDFSGYSDMAIGLGRMMGFKYLRNFNYPYISKSITEFWRRWHISLSTFFRDYVYIPLGGSRCPTGRWVFNIAVVWAITGFWHGAAWNYILWGVYYGVLLVLEKLVYGKALAKAPSFFRHAYVIAVFMFGWSFFWITDPNQLIPYYQAMFGLYGATGIYTFWQLNVWEYWPVFAICIIASTPIVPYLKERFTIWLQGEQYTGPQENSVFGTRHIQADDLCVIDAIPVSKGRRVALEAVQVLCDIMLLFLLALSMFSVVSGSFNPFIYFQF